jgi:hypothetical protein
MFSEPVDQTISDDLGGAILPAQYFPKRPKLPDGEYRLLVAVLEQAVRSYLANLNARTSQQRLAFDEVRRWFYASEIADPNGLFTFESICDLLEIDAKVLRQRLSSISSRTLPAHRFGRQSTGARAASGAALANHPTFIGRVDAARRNRRIRKGEAH